jgi:hypothetical protein
LRFHKLLDSETGSDTTSPNRSHSGSSIAHNSYTQIEIPWKHVLLLTNVIWSPCAAIWSIAL